MLNVSMYGYHDLDVCELNWKFVVKFVVCLAEPDTEREL